MMEQVLPGVAMPVILTHLLAPVLLSSTTLDHPLNIWHDRSQVLHSLAIISSKELCYSLLLCHLLVPALPVPLYVLPHVVHPLVILHSVPSHQVSEAAMPIIEQRDKVLVMALPLGRLFLCPVTNIHSFKLE